MSLDSLHPQLPFGIAQTGKAFRNEITKGKFTFRTLEFDLMEFEYFFDPEQTHPKQLFEYFREHVEKFAGMVGLDESKLRWRPHEDFELAHYSDQTEDLEYQFPWGYKEMFAIAYRTNFDLSNHQEKSGTSMHYTYSDGKKIIPPCCRANFWTLSLVYDCLDGCL